jgi:hypothetical protein
MVRCTTVPAKDRRITFVISVYADNLNDGELWLTVFLKTMGYGGLKKNRGLQRRIGVGHDSVEFC